MSDIFDYNNKIHYMDILQEGQTTMYKQIEKSLKKCFKNVKTKCNKVFIFAHNGFKADYPLLIKSFMSYKWMKFEQEIKSSVSSIAFIFCYKRKEASPLKLYFMDSLNYFRQSLGSICDVYGVAHAKLECDHSAINIDNY